VWRAGGGDLKRLQRGFFCRYDAERWLFKRLELCIDHPREETITIEHVSSGEKLTLHTNDLREKLL